MITIKIDLPFDLDYADNLAKRFNLTIRQTKQNEFGQFQFEGTVEQIKKLYRFYLDITNINENTAEPFEEWLQYARVVRSKVEFSDSLDQIHDYAHEQCTRRHSEHNVFEDARWGDILRHIQLAQAKFSL